MVETCHDAFGGVDILHNNVGILGMGGPVEHDEDEWDKVATVNVKSISHLQTRVPFMERRGQGAIVNISSVSGIR